MEDGRVRGVRGASLNRKTFGGSKGRAFLGLSVIYHRRARPLQSGQRENTRSKRVLKRCGYWVVFAVRTTPFVLSFRQRQGATARRIAYGTSCAGIVNWVDFSEEANANFVPKKRT